MVSENIQVAWIRKEKLVRGYGPRELALTIYQSACPRADAPDGRVLIGFFKNKLIIVDVLAQQYLLISQRCGVNVLRVACVHKILEWGHIANP